MSLMQKEQIQQVLYHFIKKRFNIMKVTAVKCLPLQNVDLLRKKEGKKEDHNVINQKGHNINTKKDNNLEQRRLNCCCCCCYFSP